jgi:DNA-directed RNA polymerase specialized sigma54-like protein
MDLRNDLQQVQTQRLSPLMLRSLNVLQLPIGELQRLVASEIQRNPLLDMGSNDHLPSMSNYRDTRARNNTNSDEDNLNFLENIAEECSPQDYLLAQVPDMDGGTKAALTVLINQLDERGFLSEEGLRQLGISQQPAFGKAYATLRSLSPRGMGDRDLQDCL